VAYQFLLYERDEPLAIITVNRPAVRNALNLAAMIELEGALGEAEADDSIRVVILTGAGDRAFIAGSDLQEMAGRTPAVELGPISRRRRGVVNKLETMPKPTIAAVNGYALGGGCELALACTLRLAADSATFGQPEINLGIIPGLGGTQRLSRLIGKGRAMEMVLTGEAIDAQEAFRIGLVNRVVPAADLLAAAKELGLKLAGKPPIALRLAKDAVNLGLEMALPQALELENRLLAYCAGTEDKKEGVAAFFEKRKPEWKGR
jgi:enoyl-CoA hydratase/carnithine racemase